MTHDPDLHAFWQEAEAQLSPPTRLAIAYAPAAARQLWTGFFTLDHRFATIVATAREPMLAQMRLAWWRETLHRPVADWPAGEPLLAALAAWDDERGALARLADGWEAMIGEPPLDAAAFASLAGAREEAVVALGKVFGKGSDGARGAAYRWGLADIAMNLSDETERSRVEALLASAEAPSGKATKVMRPIVVLDAQSQRALAEGRRIGGPGDLAVALRIGLLGR
ncbi:hypothetical protein [Croceicoccus sediminis]|uniref:hypothetical protein n=1 Tax=Croceicoccus sediminis TaxID=2571150 RepID=UPI001182100A|nr:hypothetical protein [Croceicoccus sediminis]